MHAALICPGSRPFNKEEFKDSLQGFSALNFKKDAIITINDQTCFVFIGYDNLEQAMNMMTTAMAALSSHTKPSSQILACEFKIICNKKPINKKYEIPIPITLRDQECKISISTQHSAKPTESELLAALQQIYQLVGPAFE